MRFFLSTFVVVAAYTVHACSAPVGELNPGQKSPGKDPPNPPPPPPPPEAPDLCESFAENNLRELTRLGFILSDQIVEGHFSGATGSGDKIRAELEIQKVHTGASFLAGMRVQVAFDANEVRRLGFPGDFIVGFGDNLYPVRDQDGEIQWWSTHAIAPVAERATFAEVINYRADRSPWIATVELVERTEDRARFRVIEAIAGELADEVWASWSTRAFAAPFPDPGPQQYIASFNYLSLFEPENLYLGSTVDFRPATPENLALVRAAVAQGSSLPIDTAALRDFAADYRTGWRAHRSPHVVVARARGFAEECCTNLGGTYVDYGIEEYLFGAASHDRLVRGGHGYRAEELCGESRIFAVGALDGITPPAPSAFSCMGDEFLDSFSPAHETRVELADTSLNREKVGAWMSSREPYYLFEADPQPRDEQAIALWSAPLSVERAMISASPALIRIADVVQANSMLTKVRVETTFTPYWYEHLTRHRVELRFECGDPRLLEQGAEYLAWIGSDGDGAIYTDTQLALATGPFLVPGVLLPNESWVMRVAQDLAQAVGR